MDEIGTDGMLVKWITSGPCLVEDSRKAVRVFPPGNISIVVGLIPQNHLGQDLIANENRMFLKAFLSFHALMTFTQQHLFHFKGVSSERLLVVASEEVAIATPGEKNF